VHGNGHGRDADHRRQIKNNLVTTKDVKNKSLRTTDFRPSDLRREGRPGSTGPQGAQGVQGPQGGHGDCPWADRHRRAVHVLGGKTGTSPNELARSGDRPASTFDFQGFVDAYETDPIAGAWKSTFELLCARVAP
jgi:hypothetical protein